MKRPPIYLLSDYLNKQTWRGLILDDEVLRKGWQYWLVRCDCGKETFVRANRIVTGRDDMPTSCRSCACKRRHAADYTRLGRIRLIVGYLQRTSKWDVAITAEFMNDLWDVQQGRCYYTGLTLQLAHESLNRNKVTTGSIDRIDSTIGYLPENVRWVHKDVNRMKNRFNEHYFLIICAKIALRHGPEAAIEELTRAESYQDWRVADAPKLRSSIENKGSPAWAAAVGSET